MSARPDNPPRWSPFRRGKGDRDGRISVLPAAESEDPGMIARLVGQRLRGPHRDHRPCRLRAALGQRRGGCQKAGQNRGCRQRQKNTPLHIHSHCSITPCSRFRVYDRTIPAPSPIVKAPSATGAAQKGRARPAPLVRLPNLFHLSSRDWPSHSPNSVGRGSGRAVTFLAVFCSLEAGACHFHR